MEKFIPYEKLSKKEKRKLDQARRQTWGELNPVTRKPENSRAYNRKKARNWTREMHETNSGSFLFLQLHRQVKEPDGVSGGHIRNGFGRDTLQLRDPFDHRR